jgi:hypothetical protein
MRRLIKDEFEGLRLSDDGHFIISSGRGGNKRDYLLIPVEPPPSGGSGCVAVLIFALILAGLATFSPTIGSTVAPGTPWQPGGSTNVSLVDVAQPVPAPHGGLRGVAEATPGSQVEVLIRELAATRSSRTAPLEVIVTGNLLAFERSYRANLAANGQSEQWRPETITITAVQLDGATPFFCATIGWNVTGTGPSGQTEFNDRYSSHERYILVPGADRLRIGEIAYASTPCSE